MKELTEYEIQKAKHKRLSVRNRDYFHSDPKGNHKFPHDHMWKVENGELIRISTNLDPDYDHFISDEE